MTAQPSVAKQARRRPRSAPWTLRSLAALSLGLAPLVAAHATVLHGAPAGGADPVRAWLRCREAKRPEADCAALRTAAVARLREAVRDLAVSNARADGERLARLLRSPEPELRCAAADALGARGPGDERLPALAALANDPVPAVRRSAAAALGQSEAEGARLLAQRAARSAGPSLRPERPPTAAELGFPAYPRAAYLYLGSAPAAGLRQFATDDPVDDVVAFFARSAGAPALSSEEFTKGGGRRAGGAATRQRGPSREEREAERARARKLAAAMKSGTPAERQAAMVELQALQAKVMAQLPEQLAQVPLGEDAYADRALYGPARFVVLSRTGGGFMPELASRYVAVFEDRALRKTVIAFHALPLPGAR